ncbi:hypothetical protein HK097_010041, partial [Rhizophlyctis rosea]
MQNNASTRERHAVYESRRSARKKHDDEKADPFGTSKEDVPPARGRWILVINRVQHGVNG